MSRKDELLLILIIPLFSSSPHLSDDRLILAVERKKILVLDFPWLAFRFQDTYQKVYIKLNVKLEVYKEVVYH